MKSFSSSPSCFLFLCCWCFELMVSFNSSLSRPFFVVCFTLKQQQAKVHHHFVLFIYFVVAMKQWWAATNCCFVLFFDLCCCHKTMTKSSSLSFCGLLVFCYCLQTMASFSSMLFHGLLVFVVALRHKKTTRSSNSSSSHGPFMFCYYPKTKFVVVSWFLALHHLMFFLCSIVALRWQLSYHCCLMNFDSLSSRLLTTNNLEKNWA